MAVVFGEVGEMPAGFADRAPQAVEALAGKAADGLARKLARSPRAEGGPLRELEHQHAEAARIHDRR